MAIYMTFDLSTTCTGVVIANVNDKGRVTSLVTEAIKPRNVNPEDYGFLKSKMKVRDKKGTSIMSYVRSKDETVVSKTEKERRDRLIKKQSEESRLNQTNKRLIEIIETYSPTSIGMEANMAFRSMDITRKLAEVAGALQAIAQVYKIKIVKLNVHSARAPLNLSSNMLRFARLQTPEKLKSMDLTKETIKWLMLEKYAEFGLDKDMTTDESDALLLLDYMLGGNFNGEETE